MNQISQQHKNSIEAKEEKAVASTMNRCKYELHIEKYFELNPKETTEKTTINVDFGILCDLLCSFDHARKNDNTK